MISHCSLFNSKYKIFIKSFIIFWVGVANSPYNPQTPGSSIDSMGSMIGSEWHTTDIEVRIRNSDSDPELAGQQGIIRSVSVRIMSNLIHKMKIINY